MKTMLCITVLLLLCLVLCLGQTAFAEGSSITIPNAAGLIENEAFAGCSGISALRIPSSVKRIGVGAFSGCSGLQDVYYYGTQQGWNAINIGTNNEPLIQATLHFVDTQGFIRIDSTNFPDANFQSYVAGSLDSDKDGWLSPTEISAVTRIECYRMGISSLKGVEYFTELTYLNCSQNNLSALDVRSKTKLQTLALYDNDISSLDVSKNTELQTLSCGEIYDGGVHGNKLSALDVTHNTELTQLAISGNQLSSLNLINNTKLQILFCVQNNIGSLDLSHNKELVRLLCYSNPITSLNLDQNTKLQILYCGDCGLTSLNLSNQMALARLNCGNNSLTSLSLSNHTALTQLLCSNNGLTSLNVSGCTGLETLECQQNSLSSLNVSDCTNLKSLQLWRSGSYTSLDLRNNTALVRANLSANNSLSSLTLGSKPNLERLWVQNTNLSSLNISNCPVISAAYNQGTRTDFGRYGQQIDNGDWYGYKLGEGLNPDSSDPVSHCQFCVDKKTSVTA